MSLLHYPTPHPQESAHLAHLSSHLFFALLAMNSTLPAELKFKENTEVLWELNSFLMQMLSFVLTK